MFNSSIKPTGNNPGYESSGLSRCHHQRVGDEGITVEAGGRLDGVFFIEMPREDIKQMKTTIEVELLADGEVMDEISTNFVGPVSRR
jgi:hypothetical protein